MASSMRTGWTSCGCFRFTCGISLRSFCRVVAGPSSLRTARSVMMEGEEDKAIANVSEGLPVVILKEYVASAAGEHLFTWNSFNTKGGRNKDALWDSIAEWAANLVENKVGCSLLV
jgi:hypothetical protein